MLEKGTANSKNINKMKKTLTKEVNNATKKLITSSSNKGDWDIEKGLKSSMKSKK